MAKRYTDTTIWKNQRWFKKLSPIHKLAWKYITDTCDHAGILKIDFSEFVDDLGVDEFNIMEFIKLCNSDFDKETGKKIERERIKLLKNNTVWITGFMKFQYESKGDIKINTLVPAVYSALTELDNLSVLEEGLSKGYLTLSEPFAKGYQRVKKGLPKGSLTLKDISISKDIIIEESKERGVGETKNGFVCYDVEKLILANQLEFEKICMATGKIESVVKTELHAYHLWLTKKDFYPMGNKAVIAGIESWILNSKDFKTKYANGNGELSEYEKKVQSDRERARNKVYAQ